MSDFVMQGDAQAAYVTSDAEGNMVLVDPVAVAVIQAVERANCRGLFEANAERIAHFLQRAIELKLAVGKYVIIILNVDDVHGGPIADMLMPNADWTSIWESGAVPVARGFAEREWLIEVLSLFDVETATRLKTCDQKIPVVVVDRGVAAVFE